MTLIEKLTKVASTLSPEELSEVIRFTEYIKSKDEKTKESLDSDEDPFKNPGFYL